MTNDDGRKPEGAPERSAKAGAGAPTKERSGTIFKAKPARKIIRARPVKAAKDAVA
jgi:hypothetical protein